jgi:hypothetical protein
MARHIRCFRCGKKTQQLDSPEGLLPLPHIVANSANDMQHRSNNSMRCAQVPREPVRASARDSRRSCCTNAFPLRHQRVIFL